MKKTVLFLFLSILYTLSYGQKDKPITLIDGPYLLEMLRKHGKNYRIDLDEARALKEMMGD